MQFESFAFRASACKTRNKFNFFAARSFAWRVKPIKVQETVHMSLTLRDHVVGLFRLWLLKVNYQILLWITETLSCFQPLHFSAEATAAVIFATATLKVNIRRFWRSILRRSWSCILKSLTSMWNYPFSARSWHIFLTQASFFDCCFCDAIAVN